MFDDRSINARLRLPATFRPHYPWYVWPVMGFLALLGLIPLWAAFGGLSRGWLVTDPDFVSGFVAMVVMGLFLLAFPVLFLWSVFRGWPMLHVDEGIVHLTSILGRTQRLHLSDYAEVSLGEAVLARGYQPRLEAIPMNPDQKLRMLALRPFVHNRHEAEELVALIRHAAGERPKPTATQAAIVKKHTRREWKTLGAITIGAFVLYVMLQVRG
ncbi:MAG: hypothetical protein LPK02_00540 [Rhodobacterales bacterium]|nr:hypothetical protein [Rhodobacterales bacterium]MDX5411522.1 hypothetical protein [Rhodobacterales bacterium]